MSISFRIKQLRNEKNLSQRDFAVSIGVDSSQFSKIERGVLQPTIGQIMEICSVYKTTADYLLFGTETIQSDIHETHLNTDYKELAEARLEIITLKNEKIEALERKIEALISNKK